MTKHFTEEEIQEKVAKIHKDLDEFFAHPATDRFYIYCYHEPLTIHVIVKNGIVQPFKDAYYNCKLAEKTVGKHVSVLNDICTNKLLGLKLYNCFYAHSYQVNEIGKWSNFPQNIHKIIEEQKTLLKEADAVTDGFRSEALINQYKSRIEYYEKYLVDNTPIFEMQLKAHQPAVDLMKQIHGITFDKRYIGKFK